jgi:hypothetical protein
MALRTADTSEGKKFNAKSTALAEDVCALLRRFGLERHHTCVDYGCGSLRIGAKLIEFLDPDRYVGLDVTDIFFTAGLDDLDPEIRLTKRPTLQLINQDSLRDLRSTPPEFLFSFAVIQHVPPAELAGFLDSFVSLIGPRTTGILFFKASSRVLHYKEASWSYPPSLLIEAVQARQPAIRTSMHTEEWSKIEHKFLGYSFLELNSGR